MNIIFATNNFVIENEPEIRNIVSEFIKKSRQDYDLEKLIDFMKNISYSNCYLVFGKKDNKIVGYMLYLFDVDIFGKKILFVWQAYSKDKDATRIGFEFLEKVGKSNNCDYIEFRTNRHAEAFMRVWPQFKPAGIILRRKLQWAEEKNQKLKPIPQN